MILTMRVSVQFYKATVLKSWTPDQPNSKTRALGRELPNLAPDLLNPRPRGSVFAQSRRGFHPMLELEARP